MFGVILYMQQLWQGIRNAESKQEWGELSMSVLQQKMRRRG